MIPRSRFGALVGLLLPAMAAAQVPTEESRRAEGEKLARAFSERTGVPVLWAEGERRQTADGVTVTPPLGLDVATYLPWLLAELSIYPDGLLEEIRMKQIILSRGLKFGGRSWGGLARPDGTLYLNVLGNRGSHNVRIIHHELFHLIQRHRDARRKLADWKKLNVEGYAYGSYRYVPDGTRTKATKGIVSTYAHKNEREDQAELFSWMVVDPAYVVRMSERDEFLEKKAARLREALRAVDSGVDAAFWSRLVGRTLGEPLRP